MAGEAADRSVHRPAGRRPRRPIRRRRRRLRRGDRIGSIRADAAGEYRDVVNALAESDLPAMCRAVAVGGDGGRGQRGYERYGVALIQPSHPSAAEVDAPFLPPECGIDVDVPGSLADRLDAAMPSRAKNYIRRTTGRVIAGSWTLAVEGEELGPIAQGRDDTLAVVKAAARSGFELTCLIRIVRAPGRPLRVMADLPIPSAGPPSNTTTLR